MAAGILPMAQDARGEWRFLLGREAADGLWAPFGGLRERGESLLQTALREGYEETMGLLGSREELARLPRLVVPFAAGRLAGPAAAQTMTVLLLVPWSEQLPLYFERFYRYAAAAQAARRPHGRDGFWEKDQVRWFSLEQVRRLANTRQLRPFFAKELQQMFP